MSADEPPFDSVDPFDPPLTDAEWEPFAAAVGIEPPIDPRWETIRRHVDRRERDAAELLADEPPFIPMPDEDIATLATAAAIDLSAARYIVRITEQRIRDADRTGEWESDAT